MPTSNYPNGFPNGVTIHNFPYVDTQNANGNVYWVDSNKNPNSNTLAPGSFKEPFGTIDFAVGRCIANQGDKIYVAAGHTESIIAAGGLDLDIAGITIIFLGEGSNRATIDFGTAVTADMDVDAANITLVNPRFTASIDALTGPIDVNAANFTIINGSYYDGTSIDTTDCVVAAATATGLKIHGFSYFIGDEGGTQKQSLIQLNGVDNCEIWGLYAAGDFGTGIVENVTDEILNANFRYWYINNTNSGPIPGLVLDANATGYADNVNIRIASGSTYTSSVAKFNWTGTALGYNADGEGGDPIGTADSSSIEGKLDTIIAETNKIDSATLATAPTANSLAAFIASGGTALGTELADSKSIVDAIGSDGTTLAYGSGSALGAIGTTHIIQKTLTSSAVVQAGVDITGVSSGTLLLEDVVMSTDATGLATGTNFTIESDNANGVAVFFGETVANLGANKTESLATGSVTSIAGVVLETGKKFIAKSTVADCTGAGTITITFKFRRVTAGATIAAA
jgi:hypothetical protein